MMSNVEELEEEMK